MPKQMSEEEMRATVDAAIRQVGATSIRDMGKVMAGLKQSHAGKLDFSRASALVKARLG
jgi:uncharacterized protein YqeY